MSRCICFWIVCILGLIGAGAQGQENQPAWRVADQLDLVPTPRRISLTARTHALDDFTIVRPEGTKLAETAAWEINDRIAKLGGKKLPVTGRMTEGPVIVLAPASQALGREFARQAGVTTEDPGEQGYAIRFVEQNGPPRVLAIGSDARGMLYAAMTLRRLIQSGGGGGPRLLEAEVRDWPAFKRRCLAKMRLDMDEVPREYIRWLARNKINYITLRGTWMYNASGSARERIVKGARAITDFAAKYGIRCRLGGRTNIGEIVSEEEWKGCVVDEGHGQRFCWTADKAHDQKAHAYAKFIDEIGVDYMNLHDVDSGGFTDPALWSERGPRCRRVYGDDHPQATADQFRYYYDVLKKTDPDVGFGSVVYPYHFQWLLPDFIHNPAEISRPLPWSGSKIGKLKAMSVPERREVVQRLTAIHRRAAEVLPREVMPTFREGGPEVYDAVTRVWEGHPIEVWVYYGRVKGWNGLWEPQQRFSKTWYRPDYPDMLYNALLPDSRDDARRWIVAAENADYAWNPDQPDAEPTFSQTKRGYDVAGRPTGWQKRSLIPRVLRRFWGGSADAFQSLFTQNVSFPYIVEPQETARNRLGNEERFEDRYKFYPQQMRAVVDARNRINRWVKRLDAGSASGVYGDLRDEPAAYRQAMVLYWMTNAAAAKGRITWARVQSERLAEQGRKAQASGMLQQTLRRLPGMRRRLAQVRRRLKQDPQLDWGAGDPSIRLLGGEALKDFDLEEVRGELRKKIEQIR